MSLVQLVAFGLLVALICLILALITLRIPPAKKKDATAADGAGDCGGSGGWAFDGDGGSGGDGGGGD